VNIKSVTNRFARPTRDRVSGAWVAFDLVIGLALFFGGQLLAQNKIYVITGPTGTALAIVAGSLLVVGLVVGLLNAQALVLRVIATVLAIVAALLVAWQWKVISAAFIKAGWGTFIWFLVGLAIITAISVWRNRRDKSTT
jgi:hypothetical protein